MFPDAFIQALTAPAADVDKNGRISLLEAFIYASRLVAQHYEQAGTLSTEHAMLDDTGDGKAATPARTGADGALAGMTYLDAVAVPTSTDPDVQQLLAASAGAHRAGRRPAPPPARRCRRTNSIRQFEKLIIELSLVSRDVAPARAADSS